MCIPKKAASTGWAGPVKDADSLVAIAETRIRNAPKKMCAYRNCLINRSPISIHDVRGPLGPLRDYAPAIERREPKRTSAVAGVDQRLRIGLPGRRNVVALSIGQPACCAIAQVLYPEKIHAVIESAVRQPASIGGYCRIPRVSGVEEIDDAVARNPV